MNRREHLLSCLAEECAEVGQTVSKALRFGLADVKPGQEETNAQRIVAELKDLISVALILGSEGVIDGYVMPSQAEFEAKLAKIERFMVISREQLASSGFDTITEESPNAEEGMADGDRGEAQTEAPLFERQKSAREKAQLLARISSGEVKKAGDFSEDDRSAYMGLPSEMQAEIDAALEGAG